MVDLEQRHGSLEADAIETRSDAGAADKQQEQYLARHPDKAVNTILLLVAMEAEALPMIESLGLTRDDPAAIPPPAPCLTYSGALHGCAVHLVTLGKCRNHAVDQVGTVPAALMTYLAVQTFRPDLVMSAGTAGGFRARGASIADVFVSSRMVNHDRRIPIPGFDAYGIGAYDALPTPALQRELGLKCGVVSSGNSLDYTSQDMEAMLKHGAAVKEMEAAAVAWSADLFDVPTLCIKAVTDIVDGDRPAQEEFLENLGKAAKALETAVPRVVQFIAGKRYSEL